MYASMNLAIGSDKIRQASQRNAVSGFGGVSKSGTVFAEPLLKIRAVTSNMEATDYFYPYCRVRNEHEPDL